MSAMSYREDNKVLWRGVRPAHNGTQLIGYGTATNNTVDVLQVTAGKKGFITELNIAFSFTVAGTGYVYWTDSLNAVIESLYVISTVAMSLVMAIPVKYWPPLEIGSSDKIRIASNNASIAIKCTAKGWEE